MKAIVIIPARLKSSRLPNKVLADIQGKPMIQHVWERGMEADVGPVYVACSEEEVYEAVLAFGGKPIMTDPDLPSGSDRVHQAYQRLGEEAEAIINLQGDLPVIDARLIRHVLEPLAHAEVDIGTLVAPLTGPEDLENPAVAKAFLEFEGNRDDIGRAHHFSRMAAYPNGETISATNPEAKNLYYHIGMYAYRPRSLDTFVSFPEGVLEKKEKLEQLRALENGMRIDARIVNTIPFEVNTPEDLERTRNILVA